ncbi:hypothetical protein [Isoptericola dokdonensis]|uniref:Uncharacterized protein n=1 Tax=Isoptericola dokdonensis DS-3 TaxID=1300344 RepID=A0A168E7M9_9MICO|nr:hypothetical protein [Isoptericola dokdonensis]ANC29696.1 hypothetical protein I598_0103 [Isoptericola dokdonensis DS-3]
MSDGFFTLYGDSAPHNWLPDWLTALGARLTSPGAEQLVALIDFDGDRHLVDLSTFHRSLADEELNRTFQTWLSESDDMIVTARRVSDQLYSVTCYLDGLDAAEIDAATRAATERVTRSPAEVVALVVDRRGATADFDWDTYVIRPGVVAAAPDLLIMRDDSGRSAASLGGEWRRDDPAPGLARFNRPA